jgi:hypothetical protein
MIGRNAAGTRLDIESIGKWLAQREDAATGPRLPFDEGHIVSCLNEFVPGDESAQSCPQNQHALGTPTLIEMRMRRRTLPWYFSLSDARNEVSRLRGQQSGKR